MKKRLNNKGFTLIETVITFAIISIVGGMFILGFSNVVRLMTDAEIIKNDTNDLYGDVLASNEKDDGYQISLEIGDYISNTDVSITSKTVNSNSTTIRLSKFSTNVDVSWLPSDAQDSGSGENTGDSGNTDDPGGSTVDGETVTARFRFVKDISIYKFPKDLNDLKTEWYFSNTFTINNALSSQASSMYDLNGTIDQYIKIAPSQSQLETVVSSLEINYRNQLQEQGNGNYKVFWFAIDMDTDISTVYGLIYPASYNKILINLTNWKISKDIKFIPIEGNQMSLEYSQKIADNGEIIVNGVSYSKSQITNYSFLSNDIDVYIASGE